MYRVMLAKGAGKLIRRMTCLVLITDMRALGTGVLYLAQLCVLPLAMICCTLQGRQESSESRDLTPG